MPKTIGITGATGFIGGTLAIELKKRGYDVVGIDLVRCKYLMPYFDVFFNTDFDDIPSFHGPTWMECDTIIHCAGTSLVGPSHMYPMAYYNNNVAKTIRLLDWCVENNKHFMFSSSASVYKTRSTPLSEDDVKTPLSPYAKSKWMVEQVIDDFVRAYGLKATIFRYFNACGALGKLHGQKPGSSHIFPRLFESKDRFILNGSNFKTPDGTCIRDYIHVRDIADAHIKAIEKNVHGVYNLGSNTGYSNREIIEAVGKDIAVEVSSRRVGDTDCLVADNTLAKTMLGWVPLSTLSDIVTDLNEWYGSNNFKGQSRE